MLLVLVLVLVILLAGGWSGYGYYRGDSYGWAPGGLIGLVLLVLLLWLILGGGWGGPYRW